MNKLRKSHEQVMNKLKKSCEQIIRCCKLLTSHEQAPTVVIMRLKAGKTTIPGCGGVVGWFPTAVRIRLGIGWLGLGLSLAIVF